MDCGLSEKEFWEMSIDETTRYRESYVRRMNANRKDTLTYIYTLCDLVGLSNSRNHNKNASYPKIEKVFPDYFDEEEMEALRIQKQNELNIKRFLLFMDSNNAKYKQEDK